MIQPLPLNEAKRILSLSNLDVDYSTLEDNFKHLMKLASRLTDMDVTLLNLVDSYTQWTIAQHGIQLPSMPREECVCQYTIVQDQGFEIKDLSTDTRFEQASYVKNDPKLRYYYGVPLEMSNGVNIGSLCVMNREIKILSNDKIDLLKIIAEEIVCKLKDFQKINELKNELSDAIKMQRKIAHDIRNPLAGIIGISDILIEPDEEHDQEEVLHCLKLINNSSKSILEIADNISMELFDKVSHSHSFNLEALAERINHLYLPLAKNKKLILEFTIDKSKEHIHFSKNKLLQIIGSPVSSAIKLSKPGALIKIQLGLTIQSDRNILQVQINSNDPISREISPESIVLNFTKELIESKDGTLHFEYNELEGLSYKLSIPQSG
ncbi:MAG: histidine kinase dimerization/phospho-acceptor domain-containing protein [Daejeonella sp.]|uniref:GAF domain-containing sensor histidine kinase n=1 Tax=Daejeonella sp. TaxID=2805397 RepID=UPI0027325C80|nr:histidine kinase dimerization/phospho-acceptor domain-containing protein [Daejeonella sp.]MDP3469435.1 histidine kinase dimerization/phospho-acceptor domain-containing protein [Daejeonella sp.]